MQYGKILLSKTFNIYTVKNLVVYPYSYYTHTLVTLILRKKGGELWSLNVQAVLLVLLLFATRTVTYEYVLKR